MLHRVLLHLADQMRIGENEEVLVKSVTIDIFHKWWLLHRNEACPVYILVGQYMHLSPTTKLT